MLVVLLKAVCGVSVLNCQSTLKGAIVKLES